ncbi:hypothetical protein DY000_02047874 [Brassica cretica]|uniref:Uncharacterized protein n=1 Tax=Brassica cretica TaxID=69181 RepID=A0ABQ7ERN1_BRACR|nr:hypothetical protein DY000_02047874 [Brassica cretica]
MFPNISENPRHRRPAGKRKLEKIRLRYPSEHPRLFDKISHQPRIRVKNQIQRPSLSSGKTAKASSFIIFDKNKRFKKILLGPGLRGTRDSGITGAIPWSGHRPGDASGHGSLLGDTRSPTPAIIPSPGLIHRSVVLTKILHKNSLAVTIQRQLDSQAKLSPSINIRTRPSIDGEYTARRSKLVIEKSLQDKLDEITFVGTEIRTAIFGKIRKVKSTRFSQRS